MAGPHIPSFTNTHNKQFVSIRKQTNEEKTTLNKQRYNNNKNDMKPSININYNYYNNY